MLISILAAIQLQMMLSLGFPDLKGQRYQSKKSSNTSFWRDEYKNTLDTWLMSITIYWHVCFIFGSPTKATRSLRKKPTAGNGWVSQRCREGNFHISQGHFFRCFLAAASFSLHLHGWWMTLSLFTDLANTHGKLQRKLHLKRKQQAGKSSKLSELYFQQGRL